MYTDYRLEEMMVDYETDCETDCDDDMVDFNSYILSHNRIATTSKKTKLG